MRILYIGHYKEFGGWGQVATDNILALDSVGVDVVCRNITLTKDRKNVPTRILQLENQELGEFDICIHHVLPHHIIPTRAKDVAFVELETDTIKYYKNWYHSLSKVDEIWVPNEQSLNVIENDLPNKPVKMFHHCCDQSKYESHYQNVYSIDQSFYNFYYIGDINDRKNIDSIIKCFHTEFENNERVRLYLKVGKFGKSSKEVSEIIQQKVDRISKSTRIDRENYDKYIVIPGEVSEYDIYSLHTWCDCFVCPSHGEAWSIPSFDAMVFGSNPICSDFGGPREFIEGDLIPGSYSVCECSDAAFPDMFTGKEHWFEPCHKSIKNEIRKRYEEWRGADRVPTSIKERMNRSNKFSHKTIGKQMIEYMESNNV